MGAVLLTHAALSGEPRLGAGRCRCRERIASVAILNRDWHHARRDSTRCDTTKEQHPANNRLGDYDGKFLCSSVGRA